MPFGLVFFFPWITQNVREIYAGAKLYARLLTSRTVWIQGKPKIDLLHAPFLSSPAHTLLETQNKLIAGTPGTRGVVEKKIQSLVVQL